MSSVSFCIPRRNCMSNAKQRRIVKYAFWNYQRNILYRKNLDGAITELLPQSYSHKQPGKSEPFDKIVRLNCACNNTTSLFFRFLFCDEINLLFTFHFFFRLYFSPGDLKGRSSLVAVVEPHIQPPKSQGKKDYAPRIGRVGLFFQTFRRFFCCQNVDGHISGGEQWKKVNTSLQVAFVLSAPRFRSLMEWRSSKCASLDILCFFLLPNFKSSKISQNVHAAP